MKFRSKIGVCAPLLMVFCLYIIGMAGCSVSCGGVPLTIKLNSPDDGTTFKTNLVKVNGVVSRPEVSVTVSSQAAAVADDGSFYAYLDLAEGKNTIEAIAISDGETAIASVNATFYPVVAVYLWGPESQEVNQQTGEITITAAGHVTHAEASVRVNGTPVEVNQDGSFSARIKLHEGNNIIGAAASFEGEEDNHSFTLIVEDGPIVIPPGQGMMYHSQFSYEESVEMKAGGEIHLGVIGDIRKGIPGPVMLNYELYPVAEEYGETEIFPEGMEVTIEPSSFTVYPNTIYHLNLIIRTTSDTPPGEYYLYFQVYGNRRFIGGWIQLDIKP